MIVAPHALLLLSAAPPPQQIMRHTSVMPIMAEFSRNTELRSEVENPFAKFRLFLFPAAFAGAAIATYFGGTGLLAEMAGLRPSTGLDAFGNLAVDLAALGGIGYFWRQEAVAQDARMRRIQMGAAIASLRVQPLGGSMAGKSVKLVDLRSGRADDLFDDNARRVVVICAEETALAESLAVARSASQELVEADMFIVPLVATAGGRFELPSPALVKGDDESSVGHIGLAQGLDTWSDVLKDERETAEGQEAGVTARRGFTLILKKNGRVGTRRLGLPAWRDLVGDVSKRAAAGLDTTNI